MTTRRLFDEIRQKWVAATPEEIVRQSLLRTMICELGYPKHLIVIEKELSELPHLTARRHEVPKRRADLLVYTPGNGSDAPVRPLLLIECKERGLTQAAREQVIGYNHFVGAPYIGIAAQEGIEIGRFDSRSDNFRFISYIPSYLSLVEEALHKS